MLYASCFSKVSYASVEASGRTWRSMVRSILSQQSCADGTTRSMDLQFRNTPAFSRKDGFSLGQNSLTGPLSYTLGINGDMAYSVMALCQFTADMAPGDAEAVLFKLFANTSGNNGASLVLKRSAAPVSNMISCRMSLRIGSSIDIPCKQNSSADILLLPRRPYLLAVVKDYGRLQVYAVDVGAADVSKQVLLDHNVGTHEPIVFSNMDMVINPNGNMNGNIMSFGIYARALSDADLAEWFKQYSSLLKRFDASYVQMEQTLQQAQAATSCSFDAATCAACVAVKDWSNMSAILASGTPCLSAISAYCTANPTKPRCECWNLNNPAYATTCAPLRGAFAGVTATPAPLPTPTPVPVMTCPDRKDDALDATQLVKSIVTPDNIIAVGKAIAQVQTAGGGGGSGRGHHRHHKHQCCCSECRTRHPKRRCASLPSLRPGAESPDDSELLMEGTSLGREPDDDAAAAAIKAADVKEDRPGFLNWLFGGH